MLKDLVLTFFLPYTFQEDYLLTQILTVTHFHYKIALLYNRILTATRWAFEIEPEKKMILGNSLDSMFIVWVFTVLYVNEIGIKNNGHQFEIKNK